MKRFYFLGLAVLFLLFFNSCKDDEGTLGMVADANLQMKATYGGEPLVMTETYTYADGVPVFFTKVKFYISDIALISSDGSKTELSEVEVLDFSQSNINLNGAEEGLRLDFSSIPVGDYTGLTFGMGVKRDLNSTQPSDYSSNHPLGESADYWAPWESYIFTKIEGKVDTLQDGSFDMGIVYHVGSDEVYREIQLNEPITITENDTQLPILKIDLEKIMVRSENDYLDIQGNPAVHNDMILMTYLADNFDTAIQME